MKKFKHQQEKNYYQWERWFVILGEPVVSLFEKREWVPVQFLDEDDPSFLKIEAINFNSATLYEEK